MNYLLSDVPFDEKECAKLIHGGIKVSNEEIFDSIRGFEILSEQRFKMSHAKQHMELSAPIWMKLKPNYSASAARTMK